MGSHRPSNIPQRCLFSFAFAVAVINTMTKGTREEKKSLSQVILSTPREVRTGTQARNLETETEAEAREDCSLLASSLIHEQLAQDHLPKAVLSHSGLRSPISVMSQDNFLQILS